MSIISAITGAVGGIVKPIAGVLNANTVRKQSAQEGKTKILLAQQDGQNSLDLTDAEWEAISAAGNTESWKDEYATITMTSWIWVALYGALFDDNALKGVKIFLDFCTLNGVEMGWLTGVVVSAAVGLKVWRGR